MKRVTNFTILGEDVFIQDPLTEMVVLGDSYTQGFLAGGSYTSPTMPEMVASMLELKLHNYGVNGAGYTIAGNAFITQAFDAIADTSYNHELVKYVFVMGGINDVNLNPGGDVTAASKLLVDTLASNFVNATIVLCPSWGAVSLPYTQEIIFRNICEVAHAGTQKVLCLYDNIKCLMNYPDLMGWDDVHPTAEGYNVLAKNITALIKGSYIPRGKNIRLTALNGWNIDNLKCCRTENSIHLYGYAVSPNEDITVENSYICTLEPAGAFEGGVFAECFGTHGYPCAIQFEPSKALNQAPVEGFVRMYNDHGNTITANSNVLIYIEVPLLNY